VVPRSNVVSTSGLVLIYSYKTYARRALKTVQNECHYTDWLRTFTHWFATAVPYCLGAEKLQPGGGPGVSRTVPVIIAGGSDRIMGSGAWPGGILESEATKLP